MTPQEVSHILQDPRAVPDSDDEQDDRERSKVRLSCSQQYWSGQRHRPAWSLHISYTYVLFCTDLTAVHDTIFPSHCDYTHMLSRIHCLAERGKLPELSRIMTRYYYYC